MTANLVIRPLTREEMGLAIDWAAAEGWNPGLHDAEHFYAADDGGFLVGLIGGEPVATISVVRYGEALGFLGLYIVHPDHRGKSLGLQIWNAGLQRLSGRTVGLDGVVAQQPNYRKSGFGLAYRNVRYGGKGTGDSDARFTDPAIVALETVPFEQVAAYDQPLFGARRDNFLRGWIHQPKGTALGLVQAGTLCGYGVLRPCREGYKLGPLFADTPEQAERLFRALKAHVPSDAVVYLDAPEPNVQAVALAKRHGMTMVFETARMYAGRAPALPLERIYGVTSFELG